jgi:hypothetical protein
MVWRGQVTSFVSEVRDYLVGRAGGVSRATLTDDSPLTHSARELGWLRRHRVVSVEVNRMQILTVFYLPVRS